MPTKPTHTLRIMDKASSHKGSIGVGWENEDGSITISLSPCTMLTYDGLKGKVLTLFPIKAEYSKYYADTPAPESLGKKIQQAGKSQLNKDADEDDVPF